LACFTLIGASINNQIGHLWRHFGDTMSPKNRGIFQLLKKETQPVIAREDWTTDGSLVIHQINQHLCPACCHWIEK